MTDDDIAVNSASAQPLESSTCSSEALPRVANSPSRPLVAPGTTHPVLTTAAPASTTKPADAKKLNPQSSFIRHSPSTTNQFAYQHKSGRELAPLLIDNSCMGGRFHLLSKELFLSSVPGAPPTDEECKKFKTPSLTKKMSEHAIYPELVRFLAPSQTLSDLIPTVLRALS